MNISYDWLRTLTDIELSANELAEQLTRVGITVEGVHPHGDDFVLDIDLTSNRPDCLSHLGIAREIAVVTERDVNARPNTDADSTEIPLPSILAFDVVSIKDAGLCHRFTARVIKNVKIGPSPDWLVKRLEAIGERSINNVADITNYVMHELGQPMHAFDLDKLSGNRIVVRRAEPGETIKTLDDVDRSLDESMLAICDAEKPVAVGGIMGGLDSSITESTTNVLLEVACFQRDNIRQTSRKLKLTTEATTRFERGVDIENLIEASNRAAELICELATGELGQFVDVYPTKAELKQISSPNISTAVERLTGLGVPADGCLRILKLLGITAKENDPTMFISPSWRHDLAIEEDLVEEVARHIGYENIADELPPAYGAGEYQATEPRKKRLRQSMANAGFNEAVSYSFIDTSFDDRFETVPGLLDDRAGEKFIELSDPVIEGAVRMRPTLLPGLLSAARLNLNHQRRDLRLFEIGKAFAATSGEDGLPNEREIFGVLVTGGDAVANRAVHQREIDFYDAKGAVETALNAVGFDNPTFESSDVAHLRRGQSASIVVNGKRVGSLGRLSEELSSDYKFKQPVYVAELDLQTVLTEETAPILYRSLPKYPAIVRDVSLIVDRAIGFGDIKHSITLQGRELCRSIEFVDVYEGKGIDVNQRSLTIRLEYRSDERTLTDAEVDEIHDQLLESVEKDLNIQRRF